MNPQGLNPDEQSAPLVPTEYSMTRAFTFILPFAFLLGVFMYLLCPCFCSMAKRVSVVLAALANALKTNTKHDSYSRPEPIPSEHHDAAPTPEATTRIELLYQQLAAMTIQRDEAVDLSGDIANERDKFKRMFITTRKRLEDSRAKVRSLNTEVTSFLANSIAAKARNEMLRDDMAADAARAKAEKRQLQENIDQLSVENTGSLKAAEAESAALRQRVASLESENRKLQYSVNASADEAQTTGLETGALRKQVVTLKIENEKIQGAIRKLSIDSGLMDLEKHKLQDAFNKLSINSEALQAQNNELQDAIDNLFAEKAELFKAAETENGYLRNQVTNLETANKILRNENKSLLDNLKVLSTISSTRVEALETRNNELQESANMSAEASLATSRELDDVQAKYSEVKHQLSLANTAKDDTVRYAGLLQQALTSTTTDLEDTRATLNLRDQDLEETKQQHKLTLENQNELAQAVHKSANDTLAAEQRTTQTLRNKITDLEHEPWRRRKMLDAQMAQREVQVATLEKELGDRIAEIRTKDTQIEDLTRDLRGKGATSTGASGAQDIDDLFIGTDEIGKLEEELARVKREHVWEIRSIRKEMDGLKRGLEEKEGEIENWRAGRDLMEKREADAKDTIAVLEERVGQLEMRLI